MLKSTIAGTALASSSPICPGARKKPGFARNSDPEEGAIFANLSAAGAITKMTLDELCAYAAQIGLKGVDLLEPAGF